MAYSGLSTHLPSNIPRGEIQLAAAGSWDHGAYRSSGRLDTGSNPCLGGCNHSKPYMLCRNYKAPDTFAGTVPPWLPALLNGEISRTFLNPYHSAPLSLVGL